MKIQKPFRYFGSKGRFYSEIRKIFIQSKKNSYVDLFAGGMEVAVNLKEELGDIKVIANVKDEHIESFLKCNKMAIKRYKEFARFLYKDIEKVSVKDLYTDKKLWTEVKRKYKKFRKENIFNFTDDEIKMVELFASLNNGASLSNSFYSAAKIEKIKIYLDK